MSETALRVTPQDYAPPAVIGRMRSRSIITGLVFAVVLMVCAFIFPNGWKIFLRSWLFSFMFWLGLTLGSLVLLMLQYTSGGNWGRVGRRFWEAGASNIWLMFLFWLPIAFGMKELYPWAAWSHDKALAELGQKAVIYLTPSGFWLRGFIYFIGWGALYIYLLGWSKREEAGKTTPAQFVRVQNISGAGIVFYAATITFGSIDWTMSLNPKWWSTVWGMLFMVGQVLTAFCFTIWLLVKLAPIEPISRMFKIDYLHDFGKMMFAFVILWAYLSFSQWLIIWSGNMVDEIRWYLMRLRDGWQYFGTALIFVHFVFPFALLLSRSLKRHGGRIVKIALLVLFMRLVDLFWLTAPNFYSGFRSGQTESFFPGEGLQAFGLADGVMYAASAIAMGGVWLFFFYWRLSKRSLMPVNDPHFVEMLEAKHG
ncbi:MAG TPA: hypothetical protein VLT16_09560 [Candidatus Limnocylindrales bacterium]|nr:hypothetical protein [Candidatus Limnocylindrales bacterium]